MPRHAHYEPAPPACCSCCCGCGGGCGPAPCYYPAPAPAPASSDQLLRDIAAHLLLSSPAPAPPPPPQPQPQPQPQPPPAAPAAHHANPYPYYSHHYEYQQQQARPYAYTHPPPPQPQPQPNASGDHGHLLLHSLLRRVAALESALPRCFPTPPPARWPPHPNPRPRRAARYQEEEEGDDDEEEEESPPSPPPPRPRRARAGPPSAAREIAARTIQAHFRRFLARRSRTLRQLKELAVLQSKVAAIRGSLFGRRGGADPAAVSEAAMGLLLRLDAIQGGDPMVREGKRAVSRELTRILEFVDKVLVKEQEQIAMGDALDTDEYHEGCNAAFAAHRPALNKKVSFSGNGQVHEPNGETENGNEVDQDSESSSCAESDEAKGVPGKRSANGRPGLAAPMPVHMESRKVAGERR